MCTFNAGERAKVKRSLVAEGKAANEKEDFANIRALTL